MLDADTCLPLDSVIANRDTFAWANAPDWTTLELADPIPIPIPALRCTVNQPRAPGGAATGSEAQMEIDAKRYIVLVQRREESGLRQLHAASHRRMFGCAMAIVRHAEMADEIVSTSFMQVWTTAAQYDPRRGSAMAWLLLITRSRSLDALRHAKLVWDREVVADDEAALHEFACDAASDPSWHLERRKREWRLQRALLKLSPIQRQVLSLTTLEGLSQDEASRHLDLPLGTVKSHARRGLAALRKRCESIGLTSD